MASFPLNEDTRRAFVQHIFAVKKTQLAAKHNTPMETFNAYNGLVANLDDVDRKLTRDGIQWALRHAFPDDNLVKVGSRYGDYSEAKILIGVESPGASMALHMHLHEATDAGGSIQIPYTAALISSISGTMRMVTSDLKTFLALRGVKNLGMGMSLHAVGNPEPGDALPENIMSPGYGMFGGQQPYPGENGEMHVGYQPQPHYFPLGKNQKHLMLMLTDDPRASNLHSVMVPRMRVHADMLQWLRDVSFFKDVYSMKVNTAKRANDAYPEWWASFINENPRFKVKWEAAPVKRDRTPPAAPDLDSDAQAALNATFKGMAADMLIGGAGESGGP